MPYLRKKGFHLLESKSNLLNFVKTIGVSSLIDSVDGKRSPSWLKSPGVWIRNDLFRIRIRIWQKSCGSDRIWLRIRIHNTWRRPQTQRLTCWAGELHPWGVSGAGLRLQPRSHCHQPWPGRRGFSSGFLFQSIPIKLNPWAEIGSDSRKAIFSSFKKENFCLLELGFSRCEVIHRGLRRSTV
jgi:hypothetical protein